MMTTAILVTAILNLLGCVLVLFGWFVSHSVTMLSIGVALTVIAEVSSAIRMHSGMAGTFGRLAIIFVIGAGICFFVSSTPWYVGGLIALAILALIQGIGVLVMNLANR